MNERFKELLYKTNIPLFPLFPGKDPAWVATNHDMEKFAELIIRECMEIVEDEDTGDVYSLSIRLAMIRIKKHFGVEE